MDGKNRIDRAEVGKEREIDKGWNSLPNAVAEGDCVELLTSRLRQILNLSGR